MDDFDRHGTTENLMAYVEAVRECGNWRANEAYKRMFVEERRETLRDGFNWWWPRRESMKVWRLNIV